MTFTYMYIFVDTLYWQSVYITNLFTFFDPFNIDLFVFIPVQITFIKLV